MAWLDKAMINTIRDMRFGARPKILFGGGAAKVAGRVAGHGGGMRAAEATFMVSAKGTAERVAKSMPRIMPGAGYGGMATNAMNGRAISSMLGGGAEGTARAITGATARGPSAYVAKAAAKKKGIFTAKRVAAAGIGLGAVGAFRNRSGRPADKVMGRPTGPYGY